MNSSFILNAISANACDLDNTKKIFDFVKSWDSETFLPKGIRMILRNQISDEEIKELESLYKRYNIKVKDIFKDKANYYYTSSQDFKNEITKVFGNAANTLALLLKGFGVRSGINATAGFLYIIAKNTVIAINTINAAKL